MKRPRVPTARRDVQGDLRWVRVGCITVLAGSAGAIIGTQPWSDDRPERFVVVSAILLVVVAVQVIAVCQMTSRRAEFDTTNLLLGGAAAAVATAVWILTQLSSPGLPA